MRSSSRLILAFRVAVAVALVGMVAAIAWRFTPRIGGDTDPRNVRLAHAARAHFDSQRRVSVHSNDAVAAILSESRVIVGQPDAVNPPDDLKEQLFAFIAGWLVARASGDPDQYKEWALRQGYTLTATRSDAERYPAGKPELVRRMWRHYTGSDPGDALPDPERVFRTFYNASMAQHGGAMRPAEVAAHAEVVFRHFRKGHPDPLPTPLDEWESIDTWANWVTVGDFVHWMPRRSYQQVFEDEGEVLAAVLFCAVRSARGRWVLYSIAAYFDPAEEAWRIAEATYSNATHPPVAIER